MGLIRAGIGAASGVLADQWREYIYCDALPANVLMKKGEKRSTKNGSNKGSDNIISNGSIVAVNEGQAMIIVEQGKVVELSAEPGEFVYDTSTEPSIFYGKSLKESIVETFKQIGKRFTFGGEAPKDQRVYFVNIKEITGNDYATAAPVPFRVVDRNVGLDMDIAVQSKGQYSYKIVDPILFYTNLAGNVADTYTRDQIDSQLQSELLTALQPAFAQISAQGVRYSELPAHSGKIAEALNTELSGKWSGLRGIQVISFGVSTITANEEDEKMIKQLQRNAALRDPGMAAAHLAGAQADAMQNAANNEGGAIGGFFGMNMAQNAGGANAGQLFQMNEQNKQNQAVNAANTSSNAASWTCECGTSNTGKFCANCGKPKPEPQGWTCECGTSNTGKFCANCGKPKPETSVSYVCNKCGWVPPEPTNPPKFCAECGDPFNEEDKK
jgi:membrane protease subunit (stomatin/prohibitin family)